MKTKFSTEEDTHALTHLQNKMDESEVLILGSNRLIQIEKKADLELFLARNSELINWKKFFSRLASRGFAEVGAANEKYNQRTRELIEDGTLKGSLDGPVSTDPQFYHQLRISRLSARREFIRCVSEFEDLFI